jgi:hypothetical protein
VTPEDHTAAIRALQSDVADIKGILDNGLRTMVQDQRAPPANSIRFLPARRSSRCSPTAR